MSRTDCLRDQSPVKAKAEQAWRSTPPCQIPIPGTRHRPPPTQTLITAPRAKQVAHKSVPSVVGETHDAERREQREHPGRYDLPAEDCGKYNPELHNDAGQSATGSNPRFLRKAHEAHLLAIHQTAKVHRLEERNGRQVGRPEGVTLSRAISSRTISPPMTRLLTSGRRPFFGGSR